MSVRVKASGKNGETNYHEHKPENAGNIQLFFSFKIMVLNPTILVANFSEKESSRFKSLNNLFRYLYYYSMKLSGSSIMIFATSGRMNSLGGNSLLESIFRA